jgi:membrane protein
MSFRSIRLREAWNWGGLSFRQLATRTYRATDQHETLDRAAVIAYYAMLALVPFLGLVLALALGFSGRIAKQLSALSREFLPPAANAIIQSQIDKIQAASPVGILSFSFVVLLWSASSLFIAVMDATNAAYGVRDSRPWWRRRLLAIVLTVAESVLLMGVSVSILFWPRVMSWIGLGSVAATVATVVHWVVAVAALLTSLALAYYYSPDVEQEWEWISPGSALAVLALIVVSLGFRLYLAYGSSYSETYGALAGVVVTLLWLYLVALTLLIGAEVNSVIEQASPHGKPRGQKVSPPVPEPGQAGRTAADRPQA